MAGNRFSHWSGMVLGTIAILTLTLALRDSAQAGGKSDDEVKVSAEASKIGKDGKQTITLTMKVNKDWHIYANPVGNDQLAEAATVIKLITKAKPQDVTIKYPAGKEANDKILGKYRYYENAVDIPIVVQRAAGDSDPLVVSVRFMACNKGGVCKLPATVKLTVK